MWLVGPNEQMTIPSAARHSDVTLSAVPLEMSRGVVDSSTSLLMLVSPVSLYNGKTIRTYDCA